MPVEYFAQGEAGVRGLRETCRSDVQRLAAKKGLCSKQSGGHSDNYQCENSQLPHGRFETNSRRSPRNSSFTAANKSYAGARGVHAGSDRAMADITNFTAGQASQADKGKPIKPSYNAFQLPATSTAQELPAVAPAMPAPEALPEEKASSALKDPQCVQEYVSDIIQQLFCQETLALPPADYMESQTDVTVKMRSILIDWLIEVHLKYRLRQETLYLTVNLIDRYLSKKQITRKQLQLVGVTAMFIASKFEEINAPELRDWVYITDNAYTKDDVLMMECTMLSTMSFRIVVPTAAHFFEHLATTNACDAVHRACAQYLLELGLLDVRMLQYKPSHMAAAAFVLSNELFARCPVWPAAMIHKSRHTEQSLHRCTEELRQCWKADRAGTAGLQAVHKKFSTSQYHAVATMSF